MFPNFRSYSLLLGAMAAAASGVGVLGSSSAAVAGTITLYQDTFARPSAGYANLSGTAPTIDVGGATWNSPPSPAYPLKSVEVFDTTSANGSYAYPSSPASTGAYGVDSSVATPFLPFTPQSGNVYTLSVKMSPGAGGGYSTPGTGWLALGFANSGIVSENAAFSGSSILWMDLSTNNATPAGFYPSTFYGGGARHQNSGTSYAWDIAGGTAATYSWTLNTTQADWTASLSEVGVPGFFNTIDFTGSGGTNPNPAISDVFIGAMNEPGTFSNFTLTQSSVPEPASLGLLAIGGLGLLLLKRRLRA